MVLGSLHLNLAVASVDEEGSLRRLADDGVRQLLAFRVARRQRRANGVARLCVFVHSALRIVDRRVLVDVDHIHLEGHNGW